jgi:signal transduction histidine kinase
VSDRERDAPTLLTHHRLLGARIHLQAQVRLVAAGVIVVGALFARDVLGIENLDVPALVVLAAIVALYSAIASVLTRRHREPAVPSEASRQLRLTMHAIIVLDFLALTVGVWIVGGARSPFLAVYLLHVILSCLLLTRREASTIACLAYGLIAVLVIAEWRGLLAPRLPTGAVAGVEPFDGRFALTVLAVYGMLLVVIVFLVTTLAERLRAGEKLLRHENVELGKTSTLRRDFLHMALHDIQAPVGVVTTKLRNMTAGIGGELSEKHQASVERSLHRLDGINQFLEEFRMLDALESGSIIEQATPVDVQTLLDGVVDTYRDQAESHGHTLTLEVAAALPPVRAIPGLLREAVTNYVTNAIKYTPDGGKIVVRAHRRARNVCIEVEDNGIGVAPEDQAKVFREFVRLDRSGTPVADARGTGLGLSIVRRIIERQGGSTGVRSQPGKGSTFSIQLPSADDIPPAPAAPPVDATKTPV